MTRIERIDKKIAELKAKKKELCRRTQRKYEVIFKAIQKIDGYEVTFRINSHFFVNSLESKSIINRLTCKWYKPYTMEIYERKSHKLVKKYEKK